jgi:glycosyltransferase involved in cell wall biosynthesis
MGGNFVVGSHHLAASLARNGHSVMHLSAGVSAAHLGLWFRDSFVRERLLRCWRGSQMFGQVVDVVPFTPLPWGIARWTRTTMRGYSRLMLGGPLRGAVSHELRDADCLIVDEPRFFALATTFRRALLVYRATDLYSTMHDDPTIVDAERVLCAAADLILATSEPVAMHLRRLTGRQVTVIANGVDYSHFAAADAAHSAAIHPTLPGLRRDRAVYVGAFDRRFGIEPLRNAVRAMPDKKFILVGPGGEHVAAGLGAPHVTALGAVPYAELPQLMRACSVGLLPFSPAVANAGRSPMKLYEYAAAGLAVAASFSEELQRRSLPTLCLARSDAEFTQAVRRAFELAADPVLVESASQYARKESWDGKAAYLLSLLPAVRLFARSRSHTWQCHDYRRDRR